MRYGMHEAQGYDHFHDIHKRSVVWCIMFMDMMGVRVSSLVKSPLHKPTILAGQVSVTFADVEGVEQVVRGGSQNVGSIPEGRRCTEASFTLLTAKPSGFEAVTYTVKRTDPRAELLITLTADFMRHSGALPDELSPRTVASH